MTNLGPRAQPGDVWCDGIDRVEWVRVGEDGKPILLGDFLVNGEEGKPGEPFPRMMRGAVVPFAPPYVDVARDGVLIQEARK